MKLDPEHLMILAAVVDGSGVVEGAASLGKSQPSLSRTIALLEARIGEPLFDRSRRPLKPTELCEALAAQGRRVLEAQLAATDTLDRHRSGKAGVLRVGGSPFFMDGVVSPRIAEFQVQNPEVRIEQRYGYWGELLPLLIGGALDAAILPIHRASAPTGLRMIRLLPGRNVIACRMGHPLLRKRNLALPDIGAYSWVAPPAGSPLYNDLKSVVAAIGLTDLRIAFSGGSLNAVLSMIAASDALTVLPYSVVFSLRRTFSIEAVNIRITHPERDLCLVLRDETPPPLLRKFERFTNAAFAALEDTILHAERKALWQGGD
ncbi:LysR family transcriptional regulator [Tabrizicola sp.]|uniref:LysR family transcriptional regulator n=1 Tax=Tabrizicola sp. TaxID=2005166 RepID=UPI003F39707A